MFNIEVSKEITKQLYHKCFFLRDIDVRLDNHIENSMDSVVIFEAIKNKLNSILTNGLKKSGLIKIDEPKTRARSLVLTDSSAIVLRKKMPKTVLSIEYHSNYSDETKIYELDCSKIYDLNQIHYDKDSSYIV